MTELLERLAAANPVRDGEAPSIDAVWRKVSEPGAEPRSERRTRWPSKPRRVARGTLALAAVVVPLVVVLAMAIPLHGAHHAIPRPTSSGTGPGKPTLDPAAQVVAAAALAGRAGSVVALDPRTGAIKVMYSSATHGAGALTSVGMAASVQYPPGATFDIVTAAAALDSGRYTPRSRIAGPSPLTVSGVPLRNEANQSYGPLTLTQALSYSVDTVFAQLGETVGRTTMTTYMKRFDFYSSPQLGAGSHRLAPSGVRLGRALVLPTSNRVDLGRLAAGQGQLAVTPLQMAMVAAAVAGGGRLMDPHLTTIAPALHDRVMTPSTARALAQMMRDVVRHGTATPADLTGLRIAGKTGTALVGGPHSNHADPWFIGFAPADNPKIAIAVALSDVRGGYGGTDAAPIAATVIQKLLGRH